MKYLRTSDLAKAVGVHPNTVRRYVDWGLLPPVEHSPSGYRRFTQRHLDCLRLCDRTQSFAILRRKASPKNPEFGRFCRKDHSRGRKNCCIRLPQVLADTKFAEKSSPSDIHRLSSSFIQRLRNLRVIL